MHVHAGMEVGTLKRDDILFTLVSVPVEALDLVSAHHSKLLILTLRDLRMESFRYGYS